MIKTKTLEKLCEELHEYPPDWEEIIRRFKANPNFDPSNTFSVKQYAKYFSEIYLDLSLEELAGKFPEFGIILDPISSGSESNDHIFHYDAAGRLFALLKNSHKFPYEYDRLAQVDGIPVVFDIKLGRWHGSRIVRRIYNGKVPYKIGPGLINSFRPEVISRRLYPIKQFFNSDVGYVLVIPKDIYDNRTDPVNLQRADEQNSMFSRFIQNNGLVVPFYTDRHTFRAKVGQVVQDYGLKLK